MFTGNSTQAVYRAQNGLVGGGCVTWPYVVCPAPAWASPVPQRMVRSTAVVPQ